MISNTSTHTWPVFGHNWAVDHLRKSIANGRIRHGYLVTGTESVGKETLARALAMALNCTHPELEVRPCRECRSCKLIYSGNHPDIVYSELDPNTGALKIEEIRNVAQKIALKPFEARYRVAIFRDFDHARPQAQDALLKTLEEPPPNALLILLAQSAEALLSTITSRSQIINLHAVPAEIIEQVLSEFYQASPEQAHLLARLSGGRIGWAIRALQDSGALDQREQALNLLEECLGANRAKRFDMAEGLSKDKLALAPLLELWQSYWRDLLLIVEGSQVALSNADRAESLQRIAHSVSPEEALKALKATREMMGLLNLNVNTRLALEVTFLDYPGLMRE
jgi:DNA polymerase III subunit delta'